MDALVGLAQGAFHVAAASCAGFCIASRGEAAQRFRLRGLAAGAAALAALIALYALKAQAMLDESVWIVFTREGLVVLDSRVGRAMAISAALLAFSLGTLALRRAAGAAGAAALAAALAPLAAAHAFAASPLAWTPAAALALHAALALAWFAGLAALLAWQGLAPHSFRAALARFSRFALPAMAAIVASGIVLAIEEGGGPALVATPFGWTLALKLVALAGALAGAARLRARLARGDAKLSETADLRREFGFAIAVVLAAGALSQMEPGAHADFDWPMPLRFAPAAAFAADPSAIWRAAAGGALGLAGMAAAIAWRRQRWGAWMAVAGLACCVGLAGPALTTAAYPTTFRRPPTPFDTATVARGAQIFAEHCAACHGRAGHGDGPSARGLSPAPADLAQPHTRLHTMGDMYWWVAHGFPGSAMPGFSGALGDEAIWSVVTYAMALSLGYQARMIEEDIAPRQPWLHALDFAVAGGPEGATPFLPRTQGSARLVVLRARCGALARAFNEAWATGPPDGLVLATVDAEPCAVLPGAFRAEGPAACKTLAAYALFRRTLSDADVDDREGAPQAMALLIDRFGYVRARWRSDEGQWPPARATVEAQVRMLAGEPEINRRGPHDH